MNPQAQEAGIDFEAAVAWARSVLASAQHPMHAHLASPTITNAARALLATHEGEKAIEQEPHVCEKCDRNREGLPELSVEHVDGRGPGWKCECGWWNWIESPPVEAEEEA